MQRGESYRMETMTPQNQLCRLLWTYKICVKDIVKTLLLLKEEEAILNLIMKLTNFAIRENCNLEKTQSEFYKLVRFEHKDNISEALFNACHIEDYTMALLISNAILEKGFDQEVAVAINLIVKEGKYGRILMLIYLLENNPNENELISKAVECAEAEFE